MTGRFDIDAGENGDWIRTVRDQVEHKDIVRTRGGMDKYGQPLGSVIVANKPNLPGPRTRLLAPATYIASDDDTYDNPHVPGGGKVLDAYRNTYATASEDHIVHDITAHRSKVVGVLDINTEASIASVLDTYEKVWPGFDRTLPAFQGRNDQDIVPEGFFKKPPPPGTVIAATYPVRDDRDPKDYLPAARHEPYGKAVMYLNNFYFGPPGVRQQTPADAITRAAQDGTDKDRRGGFALTVQRIRDQHPELNDHEIGRLYFLNHEIGHNVMNMATGEYRNPMDDDYGIGAMNTAEQWHDGFNAIMQKWGVFQGDPRPDGTVGIDGERVAELMSNYGASSPHELAAEAWAEYVMDKQPRAFAVEMGRFMERFVNKYMTDLNEAGY